jgi:hypothetical protein
MIVWEWLSLLLNDLVALTAWSCWALLIVAVLASKAFLKRRIPEPATVKSEPTCGNCGYLVKGLPSYTCPECGGNLGEVGVHFGNQWRTHPLTRIILWTFVLLVPAHYGWRFVGPRLPAFRDSQKRMAFATPKSGLYRTVQVKMSDERWVSAAKVYQTAESYRRVEVRVRRLSGPDVVTEIDLGEPGSALRRIEDIQEQHVRDWLAAADVDLSHPGVDAEVKFAVRELQSAWGNYVRGSVYEPFARVGSTNRATSTRPPWMLALWIAPWAVVWLIIVRQILVRHDQRRHTSASANGASMNVSEPIGRAS